MKECNIETLDDVIEALENNIRIGRSRIDGIPEHADFFDGQIHASEYAIALINSFIKHTKLD